MGNKLDTAVIKKYKADSETYANYRATVGMSGGDYEKANQRFIEDLEAFSVTISPEKLAELQLRHQQDVAQGIIRNNTRNDIDNEIQGDASNNAEGDAEDEEQNDYHSYQDNMYTDYAKFVVMAGGDHVAAREAFIEYWAQIKGEIYPDDLTSLCSRYRENMYQEYKKFMIPGGNYRVMAIEAEDYMSKRTSFVNHMESTGIAITDVELAILHERHKAEVRTTKEQEALASQKRNWFKNIFKRNQKKSSAEVAQERM
jgi:hypothetical protein